MSRLKSRELFIPGGFRFLQPETNFQPRPFQSFASVVGVVVAHRRGNATLAAKYSTDPDAVAEEVDRFNTRLCQSQGWSNYITGDEGGAYVPKSQTPSQSSQNELAVAANKIRNIWSGVKALNSWIDSGEPSVAIEIAEKRAARCAACPLNGQGDFTRWFTRPAAAAIAKQIEKLQSRKLSTTLDDKLGICEACSCPMRLKVHAPWKFIKEQLTDPVIAELRKGNNCWIIEAL
jgi:hypothetical protein